MDYIKRSEALIKIRESNKDIADFDDDTLLNAFFQEYPEYKDKIIPDKEFDRKQTFNKIKTGIKSLFSQNSDNVNINENIELPKIQSDNKDLYKYQEFGKYYNKPISDIQGERISDIKIQEKDLPQNEQLNIKDYEMPTKLGRYIKSFTTPADFESLTNYSPEGEKFWAEKKQKQEIESNIEQNISEILAKRNKEDLRNKVNELMLKRNNLLPKPDYYTKAENEINNKYNKELDKLNKIINTYSIEPQPSLIKRTGRQIATTIGQEVSGIGGAIEMSGKGWDKILSEHGEDGASFLGRSLEKLGVITKGFGDSIVKEYQIKNPQLYDKLVNVFTSAGTFFIPSIGLAKGTEALAISAKIAKGVEAGLKAEKLGNLTGAISMATLETSIDAGSAYNEAKELGFTDKEAGKIASNIFVKELPFTMALNKAGVFSDNSKKIISKSILSYLTEGSQEAGQQQIQNIALGKPAGKENIESFALGGFPGAVMGGATHLLSQEDPNIVYPEIINKLEYEDKGQYNIKYEPKLMIPLFKETKENNPREIGKPETEPPSLPITKEITKYEINNIDIKELNEVLEKQEKEETKNNIIETEKIEDRNNIVDESVKNEDINENNIIEEIKDKGVTTKEFNEIIKNNDPKEVNTAIINGVKAIIDNLEPSINGDLANNLPKAIDNTFPNGSKVLPMMDLPKIIKEISNKDNLNEGLETLKQIFDDMPAGRIKTENIQDIIKNINITEKVLKNEEKPATLYMEGQNEVKPDDNKISPTGIRPDEFIRTGGEDTLAKDSAGLSERNIEGIGGERGSGTNTQQIPRGEKEAGEFPTEQQRQDKRSDIKPINTNIESGIISNSRIGDTAGIQQDIDLEIREKEKIPIDKNLFPDIKSISNIENFTKKERIENNINAIKIINNLKKENRLATETEQQELIKYTGWGGVSNYIYNYKEELLDIMTEEEYKNIERSSLTAFYTPTKVIDFIYNVLDKFNVKYNEISVLEPALGTGKFFLASNKRLQPSKLYGVEMDNFSSFISKNLYQNAIIFNERFEKTFLPNDNFDLIVSNFPFENIYIENKNVWPYGLVIHDYFLLNSIKLLRPGGILATITSKGTLDKKNDKIRKEIYKTADLIGAIRLPDQTFKELGIEVTSDLLFFRKRIEGQKELDNSWLNIDNIKDRYGEEIEINKYYINNKDMLLGDIYKNYRGGTSLNYRGEDLYFDLFNKLEKMPENIYIPKSEYISKKQKENEVKILDINKIEDSNIPIGSYGIVGKDIFYRESETELTKQKFSNKLYDTIMLKQEVEELLKLEGTNISDEDLKPYIDKINNTYDNFVKKYGYLKSNEYLNDDVSLLKIKFIENVIEKDGKEIITKSDIFNKRVVKFYSEKDISELSLEDALYYYFNIDGKIDLDKISNIKGLSKEEAYNQLKGIIFEDPNTKQYLFSYDYLSGNVREKLAQAESASKFNNKYEFNIQALKKVIPEWVTIDKIRFDLSSNFVPIRYLENFINYLVNTTRVKINYNHISNTYELDVNKKMYTQENINTYGLNQMTALEIIERVLNKKDIVVYKTIYGADGKKVRVRDTANTKLAQNKSKEIILKYNEWLKKNLDKESQKEIENIYNEKINCYSIARIDASKFKLSSIMDNSFRDFQREAVLGVILGKYKLLAHSVGAGKTWEIIASAMEMKKKGIVNKPLIVIKNGSQEQWRNEFNKLYPGANILIGSKEDLIGNNRKKFLSKIAYNNWDAVIIQQSTFSMINVSPELVEQFKNEELSKFEDYIDNLIVSGQKKSAVDIIKQKEIFEKKLNKLIDNIKRDRVMDFEKLGLDFIFVDESHLFKNLFFTTKLNNIKGLPKSESLRAIDMYLKIRTIKRFRNDGKGVVFATGTPLTNSIPEIYKIMKFLIEEDLNKGGIDHFDNWQSAFAEISNVLEISPTGKFRFNNVLQNFYNLPELQNWFRSFASVITEEDLRKYIELPNAYKKIVKIPLVNELKSVMTSFQKRAENMPSDKSKDNMLKLTNDIKKASLDIRLYDKSFPEILECKINKCVDNVIDTYNNTKGGQVIFSDLGAPNNDIFSVYHEIKNKLISNKIPEKHIAFIHDYNTDKKREKLFQDFNNGKIRILLGSTDKLGIGVNIQDNLIALHHLDAPWRPDQLTQREGRIIRYGNKNKDVNIYTYITEGFDAYIWQLIERKAKFISNFMSGLGIEREAKVGYDIVLSSEEIKAITSGNPKMIELVKIKNEYEIQKEMEKNKFNELVNAKNRLAVLPVEIESLKNRINNYYKDIEKVNLTKDSDFSIQIGDKTYTDKKLAAKELLVKLGDLLNKGEQRSEDIGVYRGFSFYIVVDKKNDMAYILAKGEAHGYEGYFSKDDDKNAGIFSSINSRLNEKYIKNLIENTKVKISEKENEIKVLTSIVKDTEKASNDLLELQEKIKELENELGLEKEQDDTAIIQNTDEEEKEEEEDQDIEGGGDEYHKKITEINQEKENINFEEEIKSYFQLGIKKPAKIPDSIADIIKAQYPDILTISPISNPLLVLLTKKILGTEITLKKFKSSLGIFRPDINKIFLHRNLFSNPEIAGIVLAHEIGHAIDWLDEKSISGNILGKVLNIKKFIKQTFGDLNNKELRKELIELSKWWSPYDERNINLAKERNQSSELYADAMSVLLISPGDLEAKCPKFWKSFWDNIYKKPYLFENYLDILNATSNSKTEFEELSKAMGEDFNIGGAKLISNLIKTKKEIDISLLSWIKAAFYSPFSMVKAYLKEILPKKEMAEYSNLLYRKYIDSLLKNNDIVLYLIEMNNSVDKLLNENKISREDLGKYLMAQRIIKERQNIANPYMLDVNSANSFLEQLKAYLGNNKYAILEQAAGKFYEINFNVIKKFRGNIINETTFDELIEKNKDNYATFAVIEYLKDKIGAGIMEQRGTLKSILNPFDSTILKTISMINVYHRNEMSKLAIMPYLDLTEALKLAKTEEEKNGIKNSINKLGIEESNSETSFFVYLNGKKTYFNIPKELTLYNEMLKGFNVIKVGGILLRKLFLFDFVYSVYIKYNPRFNLFNPLRDFIRSTRAIDSNILKSVYLLGKAYYKYRKDISDYINNNKISDRLKEAIDNKALPVDSFTMNYNQIDKIDDEINKIANQDKDIISLLREKNKNNIFDLLKSQYGLEDIKKEKSKKFLIRLLDNFVKFNQTNELLSKYAVYNILIEQGENKKDAAYKSFMYAGTPPFMEKGALTPISNSIFMFSNVWIQSVIADYELASNRDTAFNWWSKIAFMSIPKILMKLALIGFMGHELKRMFEGISEYYKTNYNCLPITIIRKPNEIYDQVVFIRLPMDETSRLISGSLWKIINAENNPNRLIDMLSFADSQSPNFNPTLTGAINIYKFLTGENPKDTFRNQEIITKEAFMAKQGGQYGEASKQMGKWIWNQYLGGWIPLKNEPLIKSLETTMQLTPGLNSFLMITNSGYREQTKEYKQEKEEMRAMVNLARGYATKRILLNYYNHLQPLYESKQLKKEAYPMYFAYKNYIYSVLKPRMSIVNNMSKNGKDIDKLLNTIDNDSKKIIDKYEKIKL